MNWLFTRKQPPAATPEPSPATPGQRPASTRPLPRPSVPLTDPRFKYTSSTNTDLRATFARVRREGLRVVTKE